MLPLDAQRAFANGELQGITLAFMFAMYDNWQVAIEDPNEDMPTMQVFTDDNDRRFINIYQDSDQYQAHIGSEDGKAQTSDYFLDTYGYAVFLNMPQGIDYINLNPGADEVIHYQAQQFDMLREVAHLAHLDHQVAMMSAGQGHLQTQLQLIRDSRFEVVIVQGNQLALAPDSQGRTLLALFTHEVARNAYIDWYQEQGLIDAPKVLAVSGGEFCQMVAETQALGVVLNCKGPFGTRAFVKKVVDLVNGLE